MFTKIELEAISEIQAKVAAGGAKGTFWKGLQLRYRNRMMKEDGYDYNQAFYAMYAIDAEFNPCWSTVGR